MGPCQRPRSGRMKLCLTVTKAEVTGERRRWNGEGGMGTGLAVYVGHEADTDGGCRQTDGRTDSLQSAPVCCKLKRIRGPTVKTMTSVQHHGVLVIKENDAYF